MASKDRVSKLSTNETDQSQLGARMANIERLIILALMSQGIEQTQIAAALKVNKSTISRMIPARIITAKKKAKGA